jgi:hypothetical protein
MLYPSYAVASSLSVTVRPVHYLVVNRSDRIILVVTNSGDSPDPVVHIGNDKGPLTAYTTAIREQYVGLQPQINYALAGVVYRYMPARKQATSWKSFIALCQEYLA